MVEMDVTSYRCDKSTHELAQIASITAIQSETRNISSKGDPAFESCKSKYNQLRDAGPSAKRPKRFLFHFRF